MRVLWRCTNCHNKADPDVMKLGRCPNCQTTWGMRYRPTAVEMFRSYAASVNRDTKRSPFGGFGGLFGYRLFRKQRL